MTSSLTGRLETCRMQHRLGRGLERKKCGLIIKTKYVVTSTHSPVCTPLSRTPSLQMEKRQVEFAKLTKTCC